MRARSLLTAAALAADLTASAAAADPGEFRPGGAADPAYRAAAEALRAAAAPAGNRYLAAAGELARAARPAGPPRRPPAPAGEERAEGGDVYVSAALRDFLPELCRLAGLGSLVFYDPPDRGTVLALARLGCPFRFDPAAFAARGIAYVPAAPDGGPAPVLPNGAPVPGQFLEPAREETVPPEFFGRADAARARIRAALAAGTAPPLNRPTSRTASPDTGPCLPLKETP